MSLITKIFGDPNEKVLKEIQPVVDNINSFETKCKELSAEQIKEKMLSFRNDLKDKEWSEQSKVLENILPEVFSMARETMYRKFGQRHYDVQLIGGIVLHRGQIAEMKTGEGKTQTAILPVCLNALSGRGIHVVTPNDYLSRVGGGWTAPVYHSLGLSVGVITHDFAGVYDPDYESPERHGGDERLRHWKPVHRKEAYAADVTYGTNNEFGFDYLRDNMAPDLDNMVQRGLHYAIVDEIDSILIDEARTPLIISAPAEESSDYAKFAHLVRQLDQNEDYNIDEKMRASTLSEAGLNKIEKLLGVKNIYTEGGVREVNHIEQALKAEVLFKKDRDYVVKEGEIIIVDEFTGRMMPGRRYSEGLHQAIEAKEGVEVKRESRTLATITFQNYFRMFTKLAGMTGTAVTEAEEFHKIYGLETVVIPTNKPNDRKDMTDLVYSSEMGKYQALVQDIKKIHETGQPILIGTISIEKNELLSDMLDRAGVRAQLLNAKNHEKEAQIIAQAGKLGAVTVATNMAGRGVDIILGGDANSEEARKVCELGGLHVIGTERHESRRIDNQLRGRAGRQGDPGSSRFYLSMEDDLMRIFGGDRMKNIMATLKVPEDMPIENKIISHSIESAQKKVEANNFDIRKHLVEFDDVINKHRLSIYTRRREIIDIAAGKKIDKKIADEVWNLIVAEINMVVNFHTGGEDARNWDLKEIYETVKTIFKVPDNFQTELKDISLKNGHVLAREKIIGYITNLAKAAQQNLAQTLNELVPQSAEKKLSPADEVAKQLMIRAIDSVWTEHLDVMQEMRQGIGLRGYGQRDPLLEYKKESYRLFQTLNDLIRRQVVYSIFKVGDVTEFAAPGLLQQARQFLAPPKTGNGSFTQFKGNDAASRVAEQINTAAQKLKDADGNKVGRNDLCPCGSGKKYKKCHGK
ncbi:MAG: preprotein translocase subunit SecA [bacterium]|nr:preprotein translocase subunit SecA [bacterium]